MKLKVFIEYSETDTTEEAIEIRKRVCEYLKNHRLYNEYTDIEFVNPIEFDKAPEDVHWIWYLGKSLEYISTAHLAVFVYDWEEAEGRKLRVFTQECGDMYGFPTLRLTKRELGIETKYPEYLTRRYKDLCW